MVNERNLFYQWNIQNMQHIQHKAINFLLKKYLINKISDWFGFSDFWGSFNDLKTI